MIGCFIKINSCSFSESTLDYFKRFLKTLNESTGDHESLSDKVFDNLVNYIILGICILILICTLLFIKKQYHFNCKKPNKKRNFIYKPHNDKQMFQFNIENEAEDEIFWLPIKVINWVYSVCSMGTRHYLYGRAFSVQ